MKLLSCVIKVSLCALYFHTTNDERSAITEEYNAISLRTFPCDEKFNSSHGTLISNYILSGSNSKDCSNSFFACLLFVYVCIGIDNLATIISSPQIKSSPLNFNSTSNLIQVYDEKKSNRNIFMCIADKKPKRDIDKTYRFCNAKVYIFLLLFGCLETFSY